jgi:hypothetical protein
VKPWGTLLTRMASRSHFFSVRSPSRNSSASNLVTSARIALCISMNVAWSIFQVHIFSLSAGYLTGSMGLKFATSMAAAGCVYSPFRPLMLLRGVLFGEEPDISCVGLVVVLVLRSCVCLWRCCARGLRKIVRILPRFCEGNRHGAHRLKNGELITFFSALTPHLICKDGGSCPRFPRDIERAQLAHFHVGNEEWEARASPSLTRETEASSRQSVGRSSSSCVPCARASCRREPWLP